MADNQTLTLDCAIVGGGISGLAAAHALHRRAPAWKIRLFEKSQRIGGILETRSVNGLLIETSADSFITDPPAALNLCEQLGIEKDLVSTQPTGRRAEVLHHGRLKRIPDGFQILGTRKLLPLLCSPLLSLRGKVRACCEPFIAARNENADESLAAFAKRRFGKETFEQLIAPLVAGIYTADAEKLSMATALPRFVEMERKFGSIYRGLRAEAKNSNNSRRGVGARYGLFAAPQDGLRQLLGKIEQSLPVDTVHTRAEITALKCTTDNRWKLEANGKTAWVARKLIIATPAFEAAELLDPLDSILAEELRNIPYASCAIACFAYEKKQFTKLPESFGFVIPPCEGRQILAVSFSSNKFPMRAPDNQLLVRIFIGGATQASILEHDDSKLLEIADDELKQIVDVRGAPHFRTIIRWPRSMPQYHVGHLERIERIDQQVAQIKNFALIGNAYRGVGIPQCVDGAVRAAESLCLNDEA